MTWKETVPLTVKDANGLYRKWNPEIDDPSSVMVVLDYFKARKDHGGYYAVLCNGKIEYRHESQIKRIPPEV